MQDLQDYCKPFSKADAIWPALPLPPGAIELWWRRWLLATAKGQPVAGPEDRASATSGAPTIIGTSK